MVEDEVDPDSHSWGGMRGESEHHPKAVSFLLLSMFRIDNIEYRDAFTV